MNLYDEIVRQLKIHSMANVVIAGQSCSGKSTLANEIRDFFKEEYSVTIVCQDDYYQNLPEIPRVFEGYLLDVPEAFCIKEFRHDVGFLMQYGNCLMPNYDIATNTRIGKYNLVHSSQINIFEGLHTIDILQDLKPNITVYLDTDPRVCLKRRIVRDTRNLGVSESRVREYWNDCIQPMSERFIFPQKDWADIVIRR